MSEIPGKKTAVTYFDDPRLRMTVAGRITVRSAAYVAYLITIAACFTFIVSNLAWLSWFGVLLAFALIDRLLRRGAPDRPLREFPREGAVNLAHYLAPRAFAPIERAYDRRAVAGGAIYLEILRELAGTEEMKEVFRRLDVSLEEFRARLEELANEQRNARGAQGDEEDARRKIEALVREACAVARAHRHNAIDVRDLLPGLRRAGDPLCDRLFDMFSIESGDMEHAALLAALAQEFRLFRAAPRGLSAAVPGAMRHVRHRIMNRAWTSRPTPLLDRYGTDFTDLARQGAIGFMVGHEKEYGRLLRALARPENPNALLVGDATIGKETIVAHLAFALVKDTVPPELFDKRLVSLSIGALTAGADAGSLALRIATVVDEIMAAGNVILHIPEIQNLFGGASGAYLSLADALMPVLHHHGFPVIGACASRDYQSRLEPRSDVAGLFETIRVEEITEEEARRVLTHEAVLEEIEYGITVSVAAIKRAVEVGAQYLRTKYLPASALELLREGMAAAKERGDKTLEPRHIVKAAEGKTNVPIHEAGNAEADTLLRLEDVIHETFINQEDAVRAVARALREYRSGLARKGGPIASFLFVGPTGVGKTELAKTLSRLEFGSEEALIRFDMTEYQDKQGLSRFIGSPEGDVPGALTEAARERPYAVVLLDEFEKAFPDILNLFLQVLDEGRLTDALNRTVDLTNTIVIATSNAHSAFVLESLERGEPAGAIEEQLKGRLAEVFRPELLNRFSGIIMFKNLGPADVRRIAEIQLHQLGKQLALQGIALTVTQEGLEKISELGYDPKFGARPLRRAIEEHVRGPLAEKILRKELRRGSAISLVAEGGGVALK